MRKLASIQKVWSIEPIDGAEKIELAHVMGWQCVVNKNQFKKGDIGVYFEIDSFLPIEPRYEFLRKSSYKNTPIMGEGFKLKTQKFMGQISQGLFLPLNFFPELPSEADIAVGMDVTEWLNIKKWEEEERATTGGTTIGSLPYDVPHTDEIRVQNFPEFAEEFKGHEYYISTKMDGSSHSLSIDENGFHVCGHNYEYKDDGKCSFYEFIKSQHYQEAMERYASENILKTLTIQGEFCAPGIQKNPLRLSRPEWYVFTIRVNGRRVGLFQMEQICKALNMPTVPIEERGIDLTEKYQTVESILERADGNYSTGGRKEGIVIRTTEPVFSSVIGGPLSMKAVSNKYLLKQG